MKNKMLTIIFLIGWSNAFAALNLDGCNRTLHDLLKVDITASRRVILGSNQVLFKGNLHIFWNPSMQSRVGWSLFEEELEYAYSSPMVAMHFAENKDRLIIMDKENRYVLAEGFFKNNIVFRTKNLGGIPFKVQTNEPQIYQDNKMNHLLMDSKKLIKLFHDGHPAYLIKNRKYISETKMAKLLEGQRVYEDHMNNPARFVEIAEEYVIEVKPRHKLIELKINVEDEPVGNGFEFRQRDPRFKGKLFFFTDPDGNIVSPHGELYIVRKHEIEVISQLNGDISDEIGKINLHKPLKIFLEYQEY